MEVLRESSSNFSYKIKKPRFSKVMIYPTSYLRRDFIKKYKNKKYKFATASGAAVDPFFKVRMQLDAAFPLLDHADFEELISFAEKCNSTLVLTHHGHVRRLAGEIQKNNTNHL